MQAVDDTMIAGFLQTAYFAELDAFLAHQVQAIQQHDVTSTAAVDGLEVEEAGAEGLQVDVESLSPLVMGLRRTGRLLDAVTACRDMVAVEVKQAIRYSG